MQPFSQRFLEVYDALVQPNVGLIRRVIDLPLQPDEARLFIAAATCCDPTYFQAQRHAVEKHYRVVANGVGFTREECLWTVLGEACERYASGIWFADDLLVSSWDKVRDRSLALDQLILFDENQYACPGFPWRPLDSAAPIRWVRGRSLVDQSPRLIPAVLAYMGCPPKLSGEYSFPQLSTGQGAGGSLEQAILSGINEVIERDSFSCSWILSHVNSRVNNDSLRSSLDVRTLSLLNLPGLEALLFDISTDINISCFLSMLKPQLRRIVALGASANLCHHNALTKALIESHHTRNWTIELEREVRKNEKSEIFDFREHVLHYLNPENFHKVEFLMQAPITEFKGSKVDSSYALKLGETVNALSQAGYESLYIDTTPEDLRSIGIFTAKVIVPGLQPLHVGIGTEHRDTRRLQRVAKHWGLAWPRDLNSEPHPFP